MSKANVNATLTAQNTYTDEVSIRGDFNISVSGTWAGTVTVQRSFDSGTTFVDVEGFTANTEKAGFETQNSMVYRIGFKTGDYTSGSALVRISQ